MRHNRDNRGAAGGSPPTWNLPSNGIDRIHSSPRSVSASRGSQQPRFANVTECLAAQTKFVQKAPIRGFDGSNCLALYSFAPYLRVIAGNRSLCSARHSEGSNATIHSNQKPGPRHTHHSRVRVRAEVREFRWSGARYETSFTSQSVRLKPGAGTDRQPASDTVNTRLLQLSVRRYRLSRRSPVE